MQDLMQYLLTGSFNLHSLVMSDYELGKSTQKLQQTLINHQGRPQEAHFGIGRNLFYMHDYEGARESFTKAMKMGGTTEPCYQVWLGVTSLFLGV